MSLELRERAKVTLNTLYAKATLTPGEVTESSQIIREVLVDNQSHETAKNIEEGRKSNGRD